MTLIKLEEKIVEQFSAMWEHNDRAHRVEHFSEVFQTSLEINRNLELQQDEKLLLFSAYFHDLFAWSRENHHLLSEEFIRGTCHELITEHLSDRERSVVAGACRRHRASNKERFENLFERLFNSADRERPKSVQHMLDRAMKYRQDRMPWMSQSEMKAGAIAHLKEKYGHGGYASYPDLYIQMYGPQLDEIRNQIADLG